MERTMSVREAERAAVLARVQAERLTLREAAKMLGLSYRQARRLRARYRAGGVQALRHRSVGRPSNRRHPAALRERVLALARTEYRGAGASRAGAALRADALGQAPRDRARPRGRGQHPAPLAAGGGAVESPAPTATSSPAAALSRRGRGVGTLMGYSQRRELMGKLPALDAGHHEGSSPFVAMKICSRCRVEKMLTDFAGSVCLDFHHVDA